MSKEKRKKGLEKEKYDDWWMFALILTTLVILLESLKRYTFRIFDTNLTYSLFLLPVAYFITNYTTKKYGYKRSVVSIVISALSVVLFVTLMSAILNNELVLENVCGEFCGYVISQFVNLTIYSFLLNNTKENYLLTFVTYIFALIVYYMFYTLIHLNIIVLDKFWLSYIITLIIQSIICFALSIIDMQVKRGIEKD